MTIVRLISPALRSALLLAAGSGLILFPLVLDLGMAAIVTATVVGIVMVALALAGTDSGGRGTLPVSAQAAYDRGIAVGLMMVAAVFGLAGESAAMLVFAVAGVACLIVTTITRYSARPA